VVEGVDEEIDMTDYDARPGHGLDARLSIGLALGISALDSLRYLGEYRMHTSAPGAQHPPSTARVTGLIFTGILAPGNAISCDLHPHHVQSR